LMLVIWRGFEKGTDAKSVPGAKNGPSL